MPQRGPWSGSAPPFNWSRGFWWWAPVSWWGPWPSPPPPWFPPPFPPKLAATVYVNCRDAAASANTLMPTWCWTGPEKRTRAVVAVTRNGVPCRCACPPGRCEGKAGRQLSFRPWLPPPN